MNQFRIKNLRWIGENYEFSGPLNFLNCVVRIMCEPCYVSPILHFDSLKLQQVLNIVSEKLNFKAIILEEEVIDSVFVIEIGPLYAQSKSDNIFSFYDREFALIFSTGEEYTQSEKLLIPFDFETWVLLGITFLVGFLTILLVTKCLNIEKQSFIFGRYVKTPAFNMVIVFFGQGQYILPGRNFARYLLMMFVLFCLIIRTGYHGVQFELIYKVR